MKKSFMVLIIILIILVPLVTISFYFNNEKNNPIAKPEIIQDMKEEKLDQWDKVFEQTTEEQPEEITFNVSQQLFIMQKIDYENLYFAKIFHFNNRSNYSYDANIKPVNSDSKLLEVRCENQENATGTFEINLQEFSVTKDKNNNYVWNFSLSKLYKKFTILVLPIAKIDLNNINFSKALFYNFINKTDPIKNYIDDITKKIINSIYDTFISIDKNKIIFPKEIKSIVNITINFSKDAIFADPIAVSINSKNSFLKNKVTYNLYLSNKIYDLKDLVTNLPGSFVYQSDNLNKKAYLQKQLIFKQDFVTFVNLKWSDTFSDSDFAFTFAKFTNFSKNVSRNKAIIKSNNPAKLTGSLTIILVMYITSNLSSDNIGNLDNQRMNLQLDSFIVNNIVSEKEYNDLQKLILMFVTNILDNNSFYGPELERDLDITMNDFKQNTVIKEKYTLEINGKYVKGVSETGCVTGITTFDIKTKEKK